MHPFYNGFTVAFCLLSASLSMHRGDALGRISGSCSWYFHRSTEGHSEESKAFVYVVFTIMPPQNHITNNLSTRKLH